MPAETPALRGPALLAHRPSTLIQSGDMANWRQIQARIRKVKDTPEAATKLGELYAKTRDAMVAYELGRGRGARRAQRRSHQLVHHRASTIPPARLEEARRGSAHAAGRADAGGACRAIAKPHAARGRARSRRGRRRQISVFGEIQEPGEEECPPEHRERIRGSRKRRRLQYKARHETPAEATEAGKKRRRRGRRGGRGRSRGPGAPALPAERFAPASAQRPVAANSATHDDSSPACRRRRAFRRACPRVRRCSPKNIRQRKARQRAPESFAARSIALPTRFQKRRCCLRSAWRTGAAAIRQSPQGWPISNRCCAACWAASSTAWKNPMKLLPDRAFF